MAKKIVNDVIDERFDTVPNLPSVAVSIIETSDRLYSVISVGFNLESGQAGDIKVLHKDLDIYEAQYQFKMETINAGMFK